MYNFLEATFIHKGSYDVFEEEILSETVEQVKETAMIKSEEKEHLTTVHIKLTSKRNKNQKDRTRLTWYVKREELQEAINAIVDGSLILESDDEYIELQGKGEIELSCGAASVILKKQIKDDMYTIDVNLKSIGEA